MSTSGQQHQRVSTRVLNDFALGMGAGCPMTMKKQTALALLLTACMVSIQPTVADGEPTVPEDPLAVLGVPLSPSPDPQLPSVPIDNPLDQVTELPVDPNSLGIPQEPPQVPGLQVPVPAPEDAVALVDGMLLAIQQTVASVSTDCQWVENTTHVPLCEKAKVVIECILASNSIDGVLACVGNNAGVCAGFAVDGFGGVIVDPTPSGVRVVGAGVAFQVGAGGGTMYPLKNGVGHFFVNFSSGGGC